MNTDAAQRQFLYNNVNERNEAFGYNYQSSARVQQNYNDNWKCNGLVGDGRSKDISQAPILYYGETSVDPNISAVVDASLYNSYPCTSPDSTIQFIPHAPVEIAPRQRDNYWVADLNARIYERSLLNSPIEDPNTQYHARQSLLSTIAENLRPNSDPYLQNIPAVNQSLACQLQTCLPPAVTRFP